MIVARRGASGIATSPTRDAQSDALNSRWSMAADSLTGLDGSSADSVARMAVVDDKLELQTVEPEKPRLTGSKPPLLTAD